MSFGLGGTGSETWTLPEEKALPILKYAFDNGINTWDTVNSALIILLTVTLGCLLMRITI